MEKMKTIKLNKEQVAAMVVAAKDIAPTNVTLKIRVPAGTTNNASAWTPLKELGTQLPQLILH